jgi:hypothetical protein
VKEIRSIRRTQPVRRALAAAAVASLLGAGLAACGDKSAPASTDAGSSSSSSAGGSASSSPSSAAAPAGNAQAGQHVAPAQFLGTVHQGVAASTTAHMTMSMDLGQMGKISAQGQVDETADPPEMAMTMTLPMGGGKPADIRLVGGIFYMSMGDLTGGKFVKLDPKDPSGPLAGAGLGQMLDQTDPAKMLTKLESGISSITYVGREDVSGRQLDHYRLSVDTQQVLKSMGGAAASQAPAGMPKTVTYDVWLDDQHRFAQMTMQLPVSGQKATMKMELTDWGAPVHITAPPASQVTDPSKISG